MFYIPSNIFFFKKIIFLFIFGLIMRIIYYILKRILKLDIVLCGDEIKKKIKIIKIIKNELMN